MSMSLYLDTIIGNILTSMSPDLAAIIGKILMSMSPDRIDIENLDVDVSRSYCYRQSAA